MQTTQITKSEGCAFQVISFRLKSERAEKFHKCLEILKVEGVTDSDRYRDFIDKLYVTLVSNQTPETSKVTEPTQTLETPKPSEWELKHPCAYRAIDPNKDQWYCAQKKIPTVVCIQRQKGYLKTRDGCFPQAIAKHCKTCGREIRPKYVYCYQCLQERQAKKSDSYAPPSSTQIYRGI